MKVTKNKIFSVIIIIFLFSLFLYEINKLSFNPENITYFYDDRWPPCLELIKLGDLYNNQPMCFQGPVVYLIAYPFWILSEKYFQYMIFGLNFIFLLGTLFLILTIIRKKNIPLNILFIIFLFLLLMFPAGIKNSAVLFSTFFMTLGYYLLISRNYIYFSSLSFGLSILCKVSTLIPIAMLLLFYAWNKTKEKNKWKFKIKKKWIKTVLIYYIIFIIPFIFFQIVYPKYIIYFALTQQGIANTLPDYINTFKIIFSPHKVLYHLQTYFILLFALYFFIKRKKEYYFISSIGLAVSIFMFVKGRGDAFQAYSHYYAPIYVFLIISANSILNHFRKWNKTYKKYLFILFILFIILYSDRLGNIFSLTNLDTEIDEKLDSLKTQVEWGYHFVPKQSGYIFYELNSLKGLEYFSRFNNSAFNEDSLITVTNTMGYGTVGDPLAGPVLFKLLGSENINWEVPRINKKKFLEHVNLFKNKNISLFIFGPPNWIYSVELIREIGQDNYFNCTVYIPDISFLNPDGKHDRELYFLNYSHCSELKEKLIDYYNSSFYDICLKSPLSANFVRASMKSNGYNIIKPCNEDPQEILKVHSELKQKIIINRLIKFYILILFIFILSLVFSAIRFNSVKK